jgi:hypothetical protein
MNQITGLIVKVGTMNFTRKLSLSLVLSGLSGLNGNLFCSAADADLTIMAKPENCAHTVPPVSPDRADPLKRDPHTKVSASGSAEFHIGLSPEGKKNAETKERIELYRSQLANNEGALQAWAKLTPAQRTKTLSEVAMNKENTPARCKSIRDGGMRRPRKTRPPAARHNDRPPARSGHRLRNALPAKRH